jgi:hypothetical protein
MKNSADVAEGNTSLFKNRQLRMYVFIALLIAGLTLVLHMTDYTTGFKRFLGPIPPLFAVILVLVTGTFVLHSIFRKGWFDDIEAGGVNHIFITCGTALLFAGPTIFVDWLSPYPPGMNILFPESLAFYPAIGFTVEILFHIIPLYLVLRMLTLISGDDGVSRFIKPSLFAVALVEPLFHVLAESSSCGCPIMGSGTWCGEPYVSIYCSKLLLFLLDLILYVEVGRYNEAINGSYRPI